MSEAPILKAGRLAVIDLDGDPAKRVHNPEGVLVGAVMKGDKVIKPDGSTRIEEGDVIALFAMAADVPEVERLLQVSIDFF